MESTPEFSMVAKKTVDNFFIKVHFNHIVGSCAVWFCGISYRLLNFEFLKQNRIFCGYHYITTCTCAFSCQPAGLPQNFLALF